MTDPDTIAWESMSLGAIDNIDWDGCGHQLQIDYEVTIDTK